MAHGGCLSLLCQEFSGDQVLPSRSAAIQEALVRPIVRFEGRCAAKVRLDFWRHPRHHMRLVVSGMDRAVGTLRRCCEVKGSLQAKTRARRIRGGSRVEYWVAQPPSPQSLE